MTFEVQPLYIEDAPRLARVTMSAFHQDPHFALLFPNVSLEEIIAASAKRLPKNYLDSRNEKKRHQKVVDTSTGEIISYCRWVLPDSIEDAWEEAKFKPSQETLDHLDDIQAAFSSTNDKDGNRIGMNQEMAAETGPMIERAEEAAVEAPGLYLNVDYLATTPEHQRRGAGGLLLQQGLALADAHGLKTWVHAFPTGLALYEKYGFQRVSEMVFDHTKWGGEGQGKRYYLIREPVKKDG